MLTDRDCFNAFGDPNRPHKGLMVWDVPKALQFGPIPKRIYGDRILIKLLQRALNLVVSRGLEHLITSWDGCHNVRQMRGYTDRWSLHSWGVAFDINAKENPLGAKPKMDPALVKCFTDVGFDWGGNFKSRPDGMHFQLSSLTEA